MKTLMIASVLAVAAISGCEYGNSDANQTCVAPKIDGQRPGNEDVLLYGGAFFSSPVAIICGYADNMEGCKNIVAAHKLLYPENNNYFCSYRNAE